MRALLPFIAARLACLAVLLAATLPTATAEAGDPDDFFWREPFDDAEQWVRQPSWLGDASPTARVTSDKSVACFRVDEPGRAMKWSASMPTVPLDELPYLVVRYRAENLNTKSDDYLVYFDDRLRDEQLNALRLCDAKADGRWHVVAVDVTTLTTAESVYSMAVQVRADSKGNARLWLDWLSFAAEPPKGAQLIGRAAKVPPKSDWAAPLESAKWTHHADWLLNPVGPNEQHVERRGGATLFRIDRPNHGMKWSCDLPEPVSLEGRHYLAMRYRAVGMRPYSDYALCGMGKSRGEGPGYEALVESADMVSDGRWHTLNVDIRRIAAELPLIKGLAVQVQAAAPDATLEISHVRLVNSAEPSRLADTLDWQPGARFEQFASLPIRSVAEGTSVPWRRRLRIADWFTRPDVTIEGVPFTLLLDEPDIAGTSTRGKSELRLPVDRATGEVYLLLLSVLIGPEEPPYGTGKLRAIRDVDRFRIRLEYADGTIDECLPMSLLTRQFGIVAGAQVVVATADPSKKLKTLVLCDRAKQAAFGILAATARTDGRRLLPESLEPSEPMRVKAVEGNRPIAPLKMTLSPDGPPMLDRLVHGGTAWNCLASPCPLIALRVDGKQIPREALHRLPDEQSAARPDFVWYGVRGIDGLRVGLRVREDAAAKGHSIVACVHNAGSKQLDVALVAPSIGPYQLSEQAEEAFYLLPKRGAVLDNRACSYRQRYSGLFPVQFVDTFSPSQGRGLVLRTLDTSCLRKHYLLEKSDGRLTIGVEYPDRKLKPGERFQTAEAIVSGTDGDWHRGFEAYRDWLRTWHKPRWPRKQWFREVFNFRQRFLWAWDPLYDSEAGKFHLGRAAEEARREFGGIDYLHIFDWGNCPGYGRIYGRTGDYSPYDYLGGGRQAFRKAIADVQADGVRVGLYIEGYLLQQRGKLGQRFGREWQLIGPDGKGKFWPDSSEMFICPAVAAWREVQASTYATKVRELDVDGMYIDQFGFANSQKDCYSTEHGHPVPSYAVVAERDCTRIIHDRIDGVKPGVALYTEESPVDVTSQYQDGSFTYAMSSARRSRTRVPLNLFRFAVPDMKTIEILYCDKPTGSWATGVKWVFFNGEAIWLEGEATKWFEPETRAAIRRCYRILHKHRDAFTSLDPVPLVPTERGGLFANKFPAKGKTVYTLYNSRYRTVRGPMLRIPRAASAVCRDEWNQRAAKVEVDGADLLVSLEIGPRDVGCIVVRPTPLHLK